MESGQYFNLAPWVVFLPLIGLVINLLFGRKLGEIFAGSVASIATGFAFIVSILLAVALASHPESVTVSLGDWITIGKLTTRWAFRIDTLSVVMMLVVSGVGTLIHIYSIGYMHNDVRHNDDPGRFSRFFVYLNLFIAAMMVLVCADNFLMMFVGWEGVGLCSYLLIGFWFEKGKNGTGNAEAAKKAFITNRIGDFGLLIAMFLISCRRRGSPGNNAVDYPIHAVGCHRQVGPAPALRLASRRDGWTNSSFRSYSCCHNGYGRCLPCGA
jgi:NADH-quinone oxidoreductase subunit L